MAVPGESVWRRPGQRGSATAAPLRLALSAQHGLLAVSVLKRRGAQLPQPVLLDINAAAGAPNLAGIWGVPAHGKPVLSQSPPSPAASRFAH